jgi:hypothetical protein
LENSDFPKVGQEQFAPSDDMFHAGVVRWVARASTMISSLVDVTGGGWQKAGVLFGRVS